MSRPVRIIRNIAIGLAALVVLIVATVLIVVHTSGFQYWAKEKIVAAIAEGTGGRTEVGSFSLDVTHMHARLANLVIHGTEPPGAAPFVRVAQIDLNGRLLVGGRILGITYLSVRQPEVNVLVSADGRTNLPTPKPSAPSKSAPLEPVVDLAVAHFELSQGHLALNDQKQPLEITANNLRAQLWYRLLHQDYTGQLSLDPVYVVSGRNTPVTYRLTLPVALERDRIRLQGASIATASSRLNIDGAIENLRQPRFVGRVEGWLTLADLSRTAGVQLAPAGRGLPDVLQLDVNADASADRIHVTSLKLDLGKSHFQASGVLKDAHAGSSLQFDGSLALPELARLARLSAQPEGSLVLHGDAALDAANRYKISAHVTSRDLALRQGGLRIPSAAIATDVQVDPANVQLSALHLDALGGEFAGNATLQNFARYHVAGSLRHLDLQALLRLAGQRLPYTGAISGPVEASGDLNAPGAGNLDAQANLTIAPGRGGMPVRGHLQGGYRAGDSRSTSGDVRIENSYVELPHTRLTLAGSLAHGVNVSLTTHDLQDLLAAAPSSATSPVTLAGGGQAGFTGSVTGSLAAPQIAGHVSATHFQVEGRQFTAFAADVAGSPSGASLRNGTLSRGAMSAALSGAVGLHAWGLEPQAPLTADLQLQNGDVADLLAMAGQPPQGFSGALNATAHIAGTTGNPSGSAELHAANGTLRGEPFDRLDAQIALTDRLATIQQASLQAGTARIDLAGSFQHPRDSFSTGTIQANLRTDQVDLAKIHMLPNFTGQLQLSATIAGTLGAGSLGPRPQGPLPNGRGSDSTGSADRSRAPDPDRSRDRKGAVLAAADTSTPTGAPAETEFLLSSVQANAAVKDLHYLGQAYGDLQTTVQTSGQTATTALTSNFAGANVQVHGTTQLVAGYPTAADVQIGGLPVERVLAIAGHGDIPVSGKLAATAHVHGSIAHPEGDVTLDLTSAMVYGQPLDRLDVRASSTPQTLELTRFEAASGPSHISLTARFDHPVDRLDTGDLQFHVENGHLDLARLRAVQNARPGLAGAVEISASGTAATSASGTAATSASGTTATSASGTTATSASVPFRLTGVTANVSAAHLAAEGQNLGSLTLAAHTSSANRVDFTLQSDLAGATIQASGNGQLAANYPVTAQLTFSNVKWTNLSKLLGMQTDGPPAFEATTEGKADVSGPLLDPAALQGSLSIAQLQLQTTPQPHAGHAIAIQNQGPIEAKLDHGTVTIGSFHLTGPQTDIQVSGAAPLNGGRLNLNVNAGVDLAVLQGLSRDITSSGKITLTGGVRGTLADPQANGSLQLQNANINYAAIPNGLSNANGAIVFQGNRATIQNLNAESGGGKVTISGFALLGGNYRFAVRASATGVRVRVQEGVSLMGNADVNLNGVLDNSTASGSVTLTQLNYAPQSDLGSILTRAAPQVQSSDLPNPLLDHMKLDVRIRTSVAMRVQSSLAQNLQTDADLRVSGTASRPSLLGRVDLNEGRLVFFGNTYTVNSGSISFVNPIRIEPVLNLSLQTQTKGVTVVLNVGGSLDNMQLTYTSDPPLQFQEIVGLLSTGSVPTSDPTLLANQPAQPSQSFEQTGESAILGQAVANPVASRLQRVFGISQLQIDPAFTGSSALPTAQVTIQQRVSTNVTFTYTSALDDPNTTAISAEWALNPRWSAKALRDQNGIVSVNLLYKKQFK